MNPERYKAKKKFLELMERIIHDFCETHTPEEIAATDKKLQEIVERGRQRKQERKQRHDNGLRSVPTN